MVQVELRVADPDGGNDVVARRLVRDLGEVQGVGDAGLIRRAAEANERGLVEELGGVAVSILSRSGADALMAILRSVLPGSGDREIVAKLPSGLEFTLKGGAVSADQFDRAAEALLALLEQEASGDPA